MAKVDFDKFEKLHKAKNMVIDNPGVGKSFNVDINKVIAKLMKKVNIKVLGTLVVYLILFGLVANIYLMFSETKIYFSLVGIVFVFVLIITLFKKIKNRKNGRR